MQWFRWYLNTVSDPKFATVARRCKQRRVSVIAVWAAVLEGARQCNAGGYFDVPADEIAATLDLKPETVEAIFAALEDRGMLEGRVVVNWDKRQYASDSSAERVRKHRAKVTGVSCNEDVTLLERDGNAPETETDTEQNTEAETEGIAPPAASPGAAEDPLGLDQLSGKPGPGYSHAEDGPLRIALKAALPGLGTDRNAMRRWVDACKECADAPASPLTRGQIIELLASSPPSPAVFPKAWLSEQEREIAKAERREAAEAREALGLKPWQDPEKALADDREERIAAIRTMTSAYRASGLTGEALRRKIMGDFAGERELIAEVLDAHPATAE